MHRSIVIACLIALTRMCGPSRCDEAISPPASPLTVMTIFGTYYRGDGLALNVTIDLKETGDYTAEWGGCVTRMGKAEGTWNVSGRVIELKPTKETESAKGGKSIKGRLRKLHILINQGAIVFVDDLADRYYIEHGVNNISAYHKKSTSSELKP